MRKQRPGVAAFDFDGTLVRGDSLRPFLFLLHGRRAATKRLLAAFPSMIIAYLRGGRDAAKAALLVHTVSGLDAAIVAEAGRTFGFTLSKRVRPDLLTRFERHRQVGHRLVLVSASLSVYLEPFARLVGFDDVIATSLEVAPDGTLTGLLAGTNVRGPEKAARLRALLGLTPVELWAYGDSAGDVELLQMADHPTWIGRTPLSCPESLAI